MGDVLRRWASVCVFALAIGGASADAASAQGSKHAVLIGVSFCENEETTALPFVDNDVALLAETLAARGFDVYPFCEATVKLDLTNKKIKKPQPPTKANIERAFTDAKNGPLKNVFKRKDATLLVYFSGHGLFTDKTSGQTRLFLRDSKLNDANRTTLTAQALREMIVSTPCERRLLLLDACCAGGTRGSGKNKYSELFTRSFLEGGVDGAPTFASCSFFEKSSVLMAYVKRFDESQRKRDVSVFTYWVDEALKGRADGCVDGKADGVVGSDELFAYVEKNIAWMRSVDRGWQTPTIVASKNEKAFALCVAPSRSYWETIDDLAEQIVVKAKILGKKEIYVEEFDETFASEELRKNRNEAAALHSFAVSATEQLRASVREKWQALEKGSIMRRDGVATDRRYVVRTVVKASENARKEIEYAMSCRERTGAATPYLENGNALLASKNVPEAAMKALDDGKRTAVVPTSVRIEARGANENVWRTREIREIGGEEWLELNPGETYRVVFEPNGAVSSDVELVCARLLVDGRNSLAQYEPYVEPPSDFIWQIEEEPEDDAAALAKAASETAQTEETPIKRKVVLAPVVPLDVANFWLLNPNLKYVVDGFVDQFSQTSDAFRVVKADETDADAPNADERGSIIVAFYKAAHSRSRTSQSDAMTEPGPRQKFSTIVVNGIEPGAPLGILRLRYASAEYLARLEAAEETAAIPAVAGE